MVSNVRFCLVTSSLLVCFSVLAKIAEEDVDCSNIAKSYDRARLYLDAKNKYSNDYNGVEILQKIEEKCKDSNVSDRAAFAKVLYALGNSYWTGKGIARDRSKACEHFHKVLKDSQSLARKDGDIVNWSLLYLGDGAYWGFCEEKSWENALTYYQQISDNSEDVDPNLLAWKRGRIADMYHEGKGVEQDNKKSLALFQAIENDDSRITDKSIVAWAKYWKAHAYQYGNGVEQDAQKAANIFSDIVNSYKGDDPIAVEYAQKQLDEINQIKASDQK